MGSRERNKFWTPILIIMIGAMIFNYTAVSGLYRTITGIMINLLATLIIFLGVVILNQNRKE